MPREDIFHTLVRELNFGDGLHISRVENGKQLVIILIPSVCIQELRNPLDSVPTFWCGDP
jgi:hypothetical protein